MPWARAGRDGRTGRSYTPNKQKRRKQEIALEASLRLRAVGFRHVPKCPVILQIGAMFELPKSISKAEVARRTAGMGYHTQKPDADNLAKLIKDALNGLAWHDDCQVADMIVQKYWTANAPRTLIALKYPEGVT